MIIIIIIPNWISSVYIYMGYIMILKHLVLEHNNVLVWNKTSFYS